MGLYVSRAELQRAVGRHTRCCAAECLEDAEHAANANWYEQSIVVSDRMATLREAAKGGLSALMTAGAAKQFSEKTLREYAVPPFGKGALALFWAHLCAAAKKPLIYSIASTPFLIAEGVSVMPGLILQSFWGTLIPLVIVQIPLLALFLFLAGRASQRANATGEPVSLIRLFSASG